MPDYIRKTKIVCTLGPATMEAEGIARLMRAGMDVARLNFSHGSHDQHRQAINEVRRLSQEMDRPVGVLQDLAGPKIRLGELPEERWLAPDETVELIPGDEAQGDALPVNYDYLLEDLHEDDRILLSDGLVELKVIEAAKDRLRCRVVVAGRVSSRKGVNLPTSALRIPAFTDKDRKDLAMGLAEGVDFVALSFVRHERDLDPVHEMVAGRDRPPLIIAKLEKPQAIERLPQILAAVDGVMVARGDLGVEMPLEEVPIIQKRVITEARRAGKVVITATQMLRSMMTSPRPTRAEATDVVNAVLDGTDAVMLSDETAVGNYPAEAVRVLDRLCRSAEPHLAGDGYLREGLSGILPAADAAISRAACYLARDLAAPVIVASTTSGGTARLIARFRPPQVIVGLTPEAVTYRQLSLSWGVMPAMVSSFDSSEHMLAEAREWVRSRGLATKEQKLVLTAGVPLGQPGTTNTVKAVRME